MCIQCLTPPDTGSTEDMLPFENMVADFVKETGSHVLYRVTPLFDGDNLLASGVLMEAYSVEHSGNGICFNVFVYNVQPGIIIDYSNGDSTLVSHDIQDDPPEESTTNSEGTTIYVLNTNTQIPLSILFLCRSDEPKQQEGLHRKPGLFNCAGV